jgi:hypothetical protein
VPSLVIKTPDGHVVATCPIGTSVAAGGSADCTWFPGAIGQVAAAFASGAWTQVFHFDVPPLSSPASIDTLGSPFSTNNNQIFGLFMGASNKASSPDELLFQVNGDSLGHYTGGRLWGDANPSVSPGTVHNTAGGLVTAGSLGMIGAVADSLATTGVFFVLPKVYQSTQSGKLVAFGGYTGIGAGVQGVTASSYEFAEIHRLTITLLSGSSFAQGSALTLWAV